METKATWYPSSIITIMLFYEMKASEYDGSALAFHCYVLIVYVGAKRRAISRLDTHIFHYIPYLGSYVYVPSYTKYIRGESPSTMTSSPRFPASL